MIARRILASGCSAMALACAQAASAQSTANQPTPPTNYNIDGNGVDVVSGNYYFVATDVAIGAAGGGVNYQRYSRNVGYDDDYTTALNVSGTTVTVAIGAISDTFSTTATVSQIGTGAKLTQSAGQYIYTTRDGVVYQFSDVPFSDRFRLAQQRVTSITRPDGRILTFEYQTINRTICTNVEICNDFTVSRPIAVASNDGYRLTFTYLRANLGAGGVSEQAGADWMTIKSVVASNAGVAYCTNSTCLPGGTWPSIQYSWNTARTEETRTDAMGRQTVVGYDSANRIVSLRFGAGSTAPRTLTYDTSGRVYQYTIGASTWTYQYADVSGTRTTTITSPTGLVRTVTSDPATLRIKSDKTGTAQPVNYEYDTSTRLTRTTYPEGNKTELVYDNNGTSGRGNVTTVRQVPKTGTGTIETYASFPTDTDCTTLPAATCNLPTTTTDARGKITNYEYTNFGAPSKITLPAPSTGAVRTETRYTYAPRTAWYKNAAGTIVQASAIQKLIAVSRCATGSAPACAGTADETLTEIDYGTGSATQANNLLPLAVTGRSGNTSGAGAVSATTTFVYSDMGDVTQIDGPLGGADDTGYRRYNADRELVGVISPRPIVSDPTRRATRITRNATTGLIEKVEAGTVEGVTDTDWSAFVSLQRVETDYDPATYLKTVDRAMAGTTLYRLTQYSYDADLRAKCSASRVALVTATNVCAQGSDASGYDQVAETVYGTDGRVQKQRANLTDTATFAYTANGQVQTLTDASGNVSTYGYDAYDRANKLTYPGGTFDATVYDNAGNVTLETRRSGATVTNVYDDLNRRITRTPSTSGNTAPIAYTYDNFGRLTRANGTGTGAWANDHLFSYDALSRLTGTTAKRTGAADHALTIAYDAAGRRTQLKWWDGFYVDYAYMPTDDLMTIRENGASSGIGVLATYGYDDLGRRVSLTRGNGTVTTWTPDGMSRLASLTDNLAGTSRDQTVTYGYNGVSQLRTRQTTNDAYSYGGYDPSSVAATPNALNQLANVGGTALTYNPNGNLTADNRGNAYTYNLDNQLTVKTGTGSLAYDPIGRLSALLPGAATIRFDYDGTDLIAESDAGGNLTKRYVHGPGVDEPLVWYDGAGTTQRHWLSADERGSITAIADDTGRATRVNTYDENGVPDPRNAGRFGYTGQAWLAEVGLSYYKARMYDPVLSRFLQSDPIGYDGGMNLYAYVGGDPVNLTDPSGLVEGCPGDEIPGEVHRCYPAIVATGRRSPGVSFGWGFPSFGRASYPSPRVPILAKKKPSFKISHAIPKDALLCTSLMGWQFYAPPSFNLSKIIAAGRAGGQNPLSTNAAVGHYGTFDFQRTRDSNGNTTFYSVYSNASNYAAGAYSYGNGTPYAVATAELSIFSNLMSSNAGSFAQSTYFDEGFQDASNNKYQDIICDRQ